MDLKKQMQEAKLNIPKENIYFDEPMKKHTTFKIGGLAQCYLKIKSKEELKEVLDFATKFQVPVTVLGNGSNVLVQDGGILGITITMQLEDYEIKEEKNCVIVTCGAGMKLGKLAQKMLQKEITGLEELSGVPGSVGGAIKMNAGAHGKEMKDVIHLVTYMDLEGTEKTLKKDALEFAYRSSIFKKKDWIVTQVKFELQKGKKELIKEKMDQYATYRKEKQPIEYPSAGSTFKRGNDFITAQLIDEAGLKGYRIGGAMVSTKHSGFIINQKDATAKDVLTLINYVEKTVCEKFNKKIELEIEVVGEE